MSDWLLQTLLATSALSVLVMLTREPVRRRFGSRVTYGLWLIPAARLFMPTLTHTVQRTVPVAASGELLPEPLRRDPLLMANVAPADTSLVDRLGGWPVILLAIWLIVATALYLSRLVSYHRDRRAILASAIQLSRSGSVRILQTAEIESPVALGIIDPIIAVPADFDRRYAEREQRLVLEHELAHHGSGDLIANHFAFVLLCLQWFNPLVWAAHAAFRFDQEAACDARVLDKANADDRADYGRAIAKAASGRALLFASALDRRNSLHRRLQSMLNNSSPTRRLIGRLMTVSLIAVALPLTASRAVEYLNIPVPAVAPAVHSVPATASHPAGDVPVEAAAMVAAQPVAPAHAVPAVTASPTIIDDGNMTISDDRVVIDGKSKRWEELTPDERTRVRGAVAKARTALNNVHFDQAKVMASLANIPDKKRMEEIQREVARAQANAATAANDLSVNSAELSRWGVDSAKLAANIRTALKSVQGIDLSALDTIDRDKIAKEVAAAPQSIEKAKAELDRIQARMDAEDRH